MDTFTVSGHTVLSGSIAAAGAKNVALKTLVASLLTEEPLQLTNVPDIRDVRLMLDVLTSLGVEAEHTGTTVTIRDGNIRDVAVPLDIGARLRTSSMVMGPLLARHGKARIPNPGGCRIGARPIGRHIEGLRAMGATIEYSSDDGYFHCEAAHLHGATIRFDKNTHTGTETILLAAVLADGRTVIENAAEEPEVDDLIALLTAMGASITRPAPRTIAIEGVARLHGASHRIMPDRNEEVTWAVAAAASDGSVTVTDSRRDLLGAFLEPFVRIGGGVEEVGPTTTRYFRARPLVATDIRTAAHPGFMTDWQAPWAVLMTQAEGTSVLHETVFENRFSYVGELLKMGADIGFFTPDVPDPVSYYNFDVIPGETVGNQAIRITGRTPLHNAVIAMADLRAGATMLIAAMIAEGTSTISGIEQIDRGYEHIEDRLNAIGAAIRRSKGA